MAEYTLTVYGDDDATPLFTVGTAAGHANPYLHYPGQYEESGVDLLRGGASIGQYNLRIIDPQDGATQADRWLTSQLPDADGHSALIRRRALFQRTSPSTQVIMDGVVGRIELSDSFAGFHVEVRDIRDRGRKVRAFVKSGTATILPRGVATGYGEYAPGSGYYLIPPTKPLTGSVTRTPATIGGTVVEVAEILLDDSGTRPRDVVSHRHALTDGMIDALETLEYEVWWRPDPDDGLGWRVIPEGSVVGNIAALTPSQNFAGGVGLADRRVRAADGELYTVPCARKVHAYHSDLSLLPTDGSDVAFLIVYTGEPTEEYPLHWEGPWGTFMAALLDGDYSARDPRIRYDATAIAAIDTPIRVRITKPRDDLRTVIEEAHKAIYGAPGIDDQGRLTPVRYTLPSSAPTTTLDDANCRPIPGWSHGTDDVVTAVEVTYQRDIRVPIEADIDGTAAAGDLIASREITHRRQVADAVLDVMGLETHTVDGWMFRALGNDAGGPKFGGVSREQGAEQAAGLSDLLLNRFAYGGQTSMLETTQSVEVGDWVSDERSWRPDYSTGARGGSTLAQVTAVRDLNESWSRVTLVDAGPSQAVLSAPTLGTVTESGGVVTVPVSTIPNGWAVVEYAIAASEPAADSGEWTFMERLDSPGDATSSPLGPGLTVWTRARCEALGRVPSAWVSGGSITTTDSYRIRRVTVEVDDDGVARFDWDALPDVGGVRIEYVVHGTGTAAPAYDTTVEVDADDETYQTAASTVAPGETITADVTPYQTYSGGSVSGTAGDAVTVSADAEGDANAVTSLKDRRKMGATFDTVQIEGEIGALTKGLRITVTPHPETGTGSVTWDSDVSAVVHSTFLILLQDGAGSIAEVPFDSPEMTVEITPYTEFSGGAVGGTAGETKDITVPAGSESSDVGSRNQTTISTSDPSGTPATGVGHLWLKTT